MSAGLTHIALAACAGVCLLVVVLAARSHLGSQLSATVGAGLVALATGVALLLAARRRGHEGTLLLLALATAVWGLGQLLVALQLARSGRVAYPNTGTTLSVVAAVVGISAVLLAAGGRPGGIGLRRILLDALLLGSTAGLLVWRVALVDRLGTGSAQTGAGRVATAVLLTEAVLVGLLLLLWLRDLDHGLLPAIAGLCVYVGADLAITYGMLGPGHVRPWQAVALRCVAWPLIAVGVLRYTAKAGWRPGDAPSTRADARVTVATTVASVAMLVVALATLLSTRVLDVVTVQLALVVVFVFGAREVVNGLQRQTLLRGLTQQAHHDPLTGLGNRRALTRRLDVAAAGGSAVLTLDLDGFKEVNDVLGHARGDALLVAVAGAVRAALPAGVEAFRIGGDEFAVVVPGTTERAHAVAEGLLLAVRSAALAVPGAAAVQVSASVGVAALGTDVLTGLVESGVALRAAKEAGRDRVERYDGPISARHRRGLAVERRLREAVAAGDVVPHYQPIVDLRTRRVVGVEALARWDDPELGRVTPDEFIPVAERSGLIAPLGAAILRQSVGDISSMNGRSDLGELTLGVNCSVAQLRRTGWADAVLALLVELGLPPARLAVEVTESLFVDVDDPAVRELRALRAAGVQVAIDDFGSGYSSLAYLARMPATILKIDRALTAQVLLDARSEAVLRSIVTLAVSLPMDVVVEGVETEAEHELVRDAGASFGQGWLYAAAVPIEALAAVVADINGRSGIAPVATGSLASPRGT